MVVESVRALICCGSPIDEGAVFSLGWARGRWDGIGIRFDGSRHGLGIDILRMGDGSRWE